MLPHNNVASWQQIVDKLAQEAVDTAEYGTLKGYRGYLTKVCPEIGGKMLKLVPTKVKLKVQVQFNVGHHILSELTTLYL